MDLAPQLLLGQPFTKKRRGGTAEVKTELVGLFARALQGDSCEEDS
jgi:hypothetical protein